MDNTTQHSSIQNQSSQNQNKKKKFKNKAPLSNKQKTERSFLTEFTQLELRNFYFLADRIANQPYADVLQTYQDLKDHQDTLFELQQKLKYAESKNLNAEEVAVMKKVLELMTGTKEKILENKNLFTGRENDTLYELKYKLRSTIYSPPKQNKKRL